ncbi:MAG: hypothetical protein ACI9OJ_004960 [Myxococcota bacterium]|jgi:hypothetical protein
MNRVELPSPDRVIGPDGTAVLGRYAETPAELGLADFVYRDVMGRRRSKIARRANFKQFEYFGVVSDEVIAGCALANVQLIGAAFTYVFLPKTGQFLSRSLKRPLAAGLRLSSSPRSGESRFSSGKNTVEMSYSAAPNRRTLMVRTDNGIEIDATFADDHTDCEPMAITTQTGRNGWVFANKIAGVPTAGRIASPLGDFDLETVGAFAHHDYSAGFMRRETFWNWACLSGRIADGTRVGLNVSCGVNETGDSENCIWVDGALETIGPCRFEFSRTDDRAPWTVRSTDGRVELRFHPLGQHRERLNLWLMATDFRQDFGRFEGTLKTNDGRTLDVTGLTGFCEDHFSRW